jgi:hypothetical protein
MAPIVDIRRVIGPAVAVVLAAAVGGGIWYSHEGVRAEHEVGTPHLSADQMDVVHGLIGSEKEDFFADPDVKSALARQHLSVRVEKAGSRAIAHSYNRRDDFGFPSGAPAAAELKAIARAPETFTPFYTPIVIASWRPIAQILEANHIVTERDHDYYITDLPALLKLMQQHARWKDLADSTAFPTNKAVLINSTDVRTSNSAAMYLALTSYVANGQSVVQSQGEAQAVLPFMTELFLRQGFQESSSAAPFEDYLALGMGKTPMLVAYESQLVAFWLAHPDRLHGDMVMMYPVPTVFSKHVLVPFNERGRRLGQALERDPKLQELAHQYGFRTGGGVKGPEVWEKHGIHTPPVIVDVVDPPTHEWLEQMITGIERQFP